MTFFRNMVGKERPVLDSALGRAILTAMSPDEREHALIATGDEHDHVRINRIVTDTKASGYAAAVGTIVREISAIALPVMAGARVVGALNLVFFRSSLTPAQAADRYLDSLRATASEAERQLALSSASDQKPS